MKERPILFSGDMVCAILDGRKTQTRRVIKPQPEHASAMTLHSGAWYRWLDSEKHLDPTNITSWKCPYGVPGDRLFVRECWKYAPREDRDDSIRANAPRIWPGTMDRPHTRSRFNPVLNVIYRADGDYTASDGTADGWHPSIHMRRWASRITLEVVSVRVQRVQEISASDSLAEGVPPYNPDADRDIQDSMNRAQFADLWDSINAKRGYSWDTNPWVWAIEFKRIKHGC